MKIKSLNVYDLWKIKAVKNVYFVTSKIFWLNSITKKSLKIWFIRRKSYLIYLFIYAKMRNLDVTKQWNNTRMIKYDNVTKENIEKHNPIWPKILDYPYRIQIIGGAWSSKTNAVLNLIK